MTPILLAALLAQHVIPQKPAALDPKDPQSVAAHAIYNTRTLKSYQTTYKAKLDGEAGTIDYDGRSSWFFPGILFMHYKASGNDEQKIIRAGGRDVWMYHPAVNDWVSSTDRGAPGAGRGVQNPDEVLGLLSRHTQAATFLKPGVLEISFSGDDLRDILKNQLQKGVNPKSSKARLELTLDANNRILKFSCDATVDLVGGGSSRYTTEVQLDAFNEALEIAFTDEKKRPIPLRPEMRQTIKDILEGRK
ncbi:MAG: hypothetical protein HY293_07205 [Planctomycetes bacterium]|nr:hypothetical protein [Planctomycetota bacterium]